MTITNESLQEQLARLELKMDYVIDALHELLNEVEEDNLYTERDQTQPL
jgi:hypothetical protein